MDADGTIRSCKITGHAGMAKKRYDIVCAAVSVLMRTAFAVLSGKEGIDFKGGAPERGVMWLEADYTAEGKDFLFAAGVFLIEGLRSVAREFPKYCTLTIRRT